mgnify:CR=1 FL=1
MEEPKRKRVTKPSGFPKTGGRVKGVPNKIGKALKEMILEALSAAGGVNYLTRQAEESPAAFMALIGKVLPMTVVGDPTAPLIVKIERVIVDDAHD